MVSPPASLDSTSDERGRAARTQLFFAATLRQNGKACAVRVRNLSLTGAMIELDVALDTSQPVRLERGPLSADAEVAWQDGRRAGLRFTEPISIRAWMALATAPPAQSARGAGASSPLANNEEGPIATADLALALLLAEQLGDALAADAELLERHGRSLQSFDILVQLLTALTAQSAGRPARLDNLRTAVRAAVRSGA